MVILCPDLLQYRVWPKAVLPGMVKKARYNVNKLTWVGRFVVLGRGAFMAHLAMVYSQPNLFRDDRVPLFPLGSDLFSCSEACIESWQQWGKGMLRSILNLLPMWQDK